MTEYWKQITFWTKIRMLLAACGTGGEITLIIGSVDGNYHAIMIISTVLSMFLTQFIEDKNNNGIVDAFEKKKHKQKPKNHE